jgi:serine-type D-Ala-D-Ala carboxypeptidase
MKTRLSLELELAPRIESAITDITPGLLLRACLSGQVVCDLGVGDIRAYYDLASLTKIVFTQQAMMQAFDHGLWHLESTVGDTLPDFSHPEIRITELMTHSSGMEWWMPFYAIIDQSLGWRERRLWLYQQLKSAPCARTGKAVYSDLGYMLLGFVLEAWHGKNLLEVWQGLKADTYPKSSLAFHPANQAPHPVEQYAPTEFCLWRGKRLQGGVHDDNTWSFGGVSTHAGLFGSIDDLAGYGMELRAQLRGLNGAKVHQETAQRFAQRAIPQEAGDWALGFMLPSPKGASCGRYFSPQSVGHTGFTGTSLWYDPVRDLLVTILSNRVYGGRENKAFLALRPQIHDWLAEAL